MPIDYRIYHDRRLVVASGRGIVRDEDVFGYQRGVWSRPEVAGYDELVDMTGVESIALPSVARVRDLASLSAGMDPSIPSKFAIVAPQDIAFGLGRMYETYRSMHPASMKEMAVFRTLPEALVFLGVESLT